MGSSIPTPTEPQPSETHHLKQNIEEIANNVLQEESFNVVVSGPSQAGKSTLINVMFGKSVTQVGLNGAPCTQEMSIHKLEGLRLEIIDTRGLERDNNKETEKQLEDAKPHIIWLVLNYQGSTERADFELLKKFPNVPVVVIINKVDTLKRSFVDFEKDNSLNGKLKNMRTMLLEKQKLHRNIKKIVAVHLFDEEDSSFEPIGVDSIVEATISLLDSAAAVAFTRKVDAFKTKRLLGSVAIIFGFTSSATAAAFIPIPILDSVVITAIQVAMIISLFGVWGVTGNTIKTVAKSVAKGLVGGAVIGFGVSYAIGVVAGDVLKLIPGIGSIVGGIIDASLAAITTLIAGAVVTIWLNTKRLDEVEQMTEDELERSINEFVKSDKVKNFIWEIQGKIPSEICTLMEAFKIDSDSVEDTKSVDLERDVTVERMETAELKNPVENIS